MSWDSFSRCILEFQNLFHVFPQLLYSILKIQIYDLHLKANTEEAKKLYHLNFGGLSNCGMIRTHQHFFSLFKSNENVVKEAISSEFQNLKDEFFREFEKLLSELLSKEPIYLMKSEKKLLNFKQTILKSLPQYEMTAVEKKISEKVRESPSNRRQLSNLSEFMANLQKVEIFNVLSSFKNEVDSTLTPIINSQAQEKCNKVNEVEVKSKQENILTESEVLSCPPNQALIASNFRLDDPSLNINFLEKSLIEKVIKKETVKQKTPFLKEFNPKFMKKENIDKKILRRFRKYVRNCIGNEASHSNDHDSYNESIQESSIGKHNGENSFIQFFAYKKVLPPFKVGSLHFKSFSAEYLAWVFSDQQLKNYYETFAEELTDKITEELINDYNLKVNDSKICDKLPHYIKNLSNFYGNETEEIVTAQFNNCKSAQSVKSDKDSSTNLTVMNIECNSIIEEEKERTSEQRLEDFIGLWPDNDITNLHNLDAFDCQYIRFV